MTVRINVLGPLRVEAGDRVLEARDFGGAKPKQLLELLVIERGGPVPKDRLAEHLWGDRLPRNVAASLETYISVLRNRLEPGGRRADSVVVTVPGGYCLDLDRVEVDAVAFDRLLDEGRAADALALVRGELLADEPYADWAVAARERHRERRLAALGDAGEQALARGDFMHALIRADAAVAVDALCERAYRLGMLASYGLGRQEDALRWFDRCAQALLDQLGVAPMLETEALAASIARHRPLGDLLPTAAADGPAPLAPGAPPLVGRSSELDALVDAVRAKTLTLVAGEAGIGKTRLLHEAAARLAAGGTPVVRVRCFELEKVLALVPLRAAAAELGVDVPDRADALGVLDALAAGLAAARSALFVDDLQWADGFTIAGVGYLARHGVPVAGAYRVEEVEFGHPLLLLHAQVIGLEALTLDDLDGDVELFAQTGGHPLFVTRWREHPPAPGEPLPVSLRDTAVARCHLAGTHGFHVLLNASVFERPFTADDLAAATGEDAVRLVAHLDRLVGMRLLDRRGEAYTFRYGVVRQALLGSLTPGRRRLLAERAARAALVVF